ncbi:3289_t:CDS:1, partial [Entrophospora sp. SA101]
KELLLEGKYQQLVNDGILKAQRFIEKDFKQSMLEKRGELIYGTKVNTSEKVSAFRKKLDCIIENGEWQIDLTPRPVIRHKQEPLFGKCDRNNHYLQQVQNSPSETDKASIKEYFENSRASVKYLWKNKHRDETCSLPKFTKKQACKLLSGRRISIYGDSTSFQLHDLLVDYFREGPLQCYGELFCKDHILCKVEDNDDPEKPEFKESSVKFIRSDHLTVSNALFESGVVDLNDISIGWKAFIGYYNVIILNTGHHYQDDELFIASLITMVNFVRERSPNSLIIYKASTVGHLNCSNLQHPLKDERSYSEIDELPYNWNLIHKQNIMAKKIIEAAGGVYMDVEKLMETRIDGHIGGQDCLRWCIPGPADVWLDLLFFILNELNH